MQTHLVGSAQVGVVELHDTGVRRPEQGPPEEKGSHRCHTANMADLKE